MGSGQIQIQIQIQIHKRELVNGKGCKTREEAKQDAFKYIEPYYDTRRMHSSIGYSAPCDLERDVA